jgi:hypothetical protein|tara:strand:+ start:625 stop:1395 length:771 start_codon:yes stop_codon:yes gene_type:complete
MNATKTKIPSVEKNWEIKDRTYVLANGKSPISWTIQTKHTARKPLLWFDEETGINREIRYATNQRSLFVDEQDGTATLAHAVFLDGVMYVPKEDQNLQKLLSLYHPQRNELWTEIDEVQEAKDEIDILELELEALNLVHEIDIEHLEAIMRTELGSSVAKLSSKELKRDAYKFAKSNPNLFLELAEDEDIKLRNLANRAVEVGILQLTDDNTVFKFANGKKVLTVPFEQHPYAALAQYFKTDEGVDLMKSITKKLS